MSDLDLAIRAHLPSFNLSTGDMSNFNFSRSNPNIVPVISPCEYNRASIYTICLFLASAATALIFWGSIKYVLPFKTTNIHTVDCGCLWDERREVVVIGHHDSKEIREHMSAFEIHYAWWTAKWRRLRVRHVWKENGWHEMT